MKAYKNLFGKISSIENLRLAFKKAKRGKASKWYVKKFEYNLQNELQKLKTELENQTYKPKPLARFVVRDPKTRVIFASAFKDRVVHHAICNIIEPIFEKVFICDTYANRKNRGVHAALKRFDQFKRKVSQNGRLVKNAKDNNMVVGYVLKGDIKHYFQTIDHEVLLKIIRKKISDEKVLSLIRTILENYDQKIPGKGVPLGNLTSQFLANVYLSELDYFVKQKLKANYYIRYVDDFIIFHRSKETLKSYRKEIENFLRSLMIKLHTEKTKILPLSGGINFLGFKIFYHYKLPIKRNVQSFERKFCASKVQKIEIKSLEGWFGYIMHGNTYRLRRKISKEIGGRLNVNFQQ